MCKAIEMALANHGMGLSEMISEVDALVFADEEILVGHLNDKDRRAVRVEDKKRAKERNKRLYNPNDVNHWGKKAEYNVFRGITPVFHGEEEPVAFIKKSRKNGTQQTFDKVENRKIRYQQFEPEEPVEVEDDDNNLVRQKFANGEDFTVYFAHDEFDDYFDRTIGELCTNLTHEYKRIACERYYELMIKKREIEGQITDLKTNLAFLKEEISEIIQALNER